MAREILIGVLTAAAAAVLQWMLWDLLQPFIWILFYPAAFFAASMGGRVAGLASGLAAVAFAAFIFIEPTLTFKASKLDALHTAWVFLAVVYLIANQQEKYLRLKAQLTSALKSSEDERTRLTDDFDRRAQLDDIKFTILADSLPQIVWATDASGKNIYFNQAWMHYTGMRLADSVGDGWNDPFHPDDKLRAWEAWRHATEDLAEYSLEVRLRRSDGAYRWWLVRGIPYKDSSGAIARWFGTCTDIHDLKQAMTDLAQEKGRIQTVFDNSPDGLAILRPDGEISLFNQKFASYFGFAHTSDMPPRYSDLYAMLEVYQVDGQPLDRAKAPFARALAGESVNSQDIHFTDRRTGRSWYGSHSAMPIWNEDKAVTGVVVSLRDVTQRIESEMHLLRLVNEQNLILQSDMFGFAKMRERQFVWVNSTFSKTFGYAQEELVGHSSRILYPNEASFLAFGQTIQESRRSDSGAVQEVLRLQRKDGSTGWFVVGGGPVASGSSDLIWMCVDVTEERKNRELLETYLDRLRKSMRETLLVLSKTVETHDPYTAGHQLRVGNIAAEIGKIMGLDQPHVEGLRLMGLIHDIGKIGIPAEILSKPGKLLPEEFNLVKAHARIGHEILEQVDFDIPVAQVAYQHHERMDGSGYPQGLTGERILLESRIIAVADVVEAIASHRPYRPGLGLDQALEEIRSGRGIRYDAAVVDACLTLFLERGYALQVVGTPLFTSGERMPNTIAQAPWPPDPTH